MSEDENATLIIRELFDTVDFDSSGYIDENELAAVVDLDPTDLKEIFNQLDSDKDGKISIEEFIENYKQFQNIADQNLVKNKQNTKQNNNNVDILQNKNTFDVSKKSPREIINQLPQSTHRSSTYQGHDVSRPFKRSPLRRDVKRKAARYLGQEYLDDLYEIARSRDDPMLIESLENFLTATVENLLQKQSENEKLDTALKRATEKNSEIANELEFEMEQQVAMLEAKIREEEQLKLAQQKQEANFQILKAQQELDEMENKVKSLEEKVSEKVSEIPESIINVIHKKDKENEALQIKLLEFQTQMALMRTEVANMKSEYDEQSERLTNERGTVLTCVQEQENLTRQLHLLHEANRKLHDTNDDLRSALDCKRSRSLSQSLNMSSSSPVKKLFNSASPIKRPNLASSFRSDPGTYSMMSKKSLSSVNSDFNDTDEDTHRSILPQDHEIIQPEINNVSLLSELMAADGNVYGSPMFNTPVRGDITPNSFTEKTPVQPSSDREQFVRQLEILCDTNKRLGESNDELRQALGLLSETLRNENKMSSIPRPNPTGCQSAPVTPLRKKHHSDIVRPQSTSSPRKVLLTKSSHRSSMPDCLDEQQGVIIPLAKPKKKIKKINNNIPSVINNINKIDKSLSCSFNSSTESMLDVEQNNNKIKNDRTYSLSESLNTSDIAASLVDDFTDEEKNRIPNTQKEILMDSSSSNKLLSNSFPEKSNKSLNETFDIESESEFLTNEVMQENDDSSIFDETSQFNETTRLNETTQIDDTTRYNESALISDSTQQSNISEHTKHEEDMSNSSCEDKDIYTRDSEYTISPTFGSTSLKSYSSHNHNNKTTANSEFIVDNKCGCGKRIQQEDFTICDDCFDDDTDVVIEEISFDENSSSVYSAPSATIYTDVSKQNLDEETTFNVPDSCNRDQSVQCDIEYPLNELDESNITELNKSQNNLTFVNHNCDPRFCCCDIQETTNPLEKSTQVTDFMLLQTLEEISSPVFVIDVESSHNIDDFFNEMDKLIENTTSLQNYDDSKPAEVTTKPVECAKVENLNISDNKKLELSQPSSLHVQPAYTTRQNISDLANKSKSFNTQSPVEYCPVCQHVITLHETGLKLCLCTNNDDDGDDGFLYKSINQVPESIFLTDSDSNNYSDQETTQLSPLKRVQPIGSESDQDATNETNFGFSKDMSWLSGISSTYSVFHQLEAELSMFSRRQPDEDIDEDDMDDEELIRIVDLTNPDDEEFSITDEPITIEEKVLEPRGSAVGADTSNDVSHDHSNAVSLDNSFEAATSKEPDRLFKLVLAGNAAVGKSSFIIRLCKDKFYSALNSTLGVDFQQKVMNVDGKNIALQLWDTAGQERFRSIAKSYFRRVDGVVLLYDVTCENSFLDVRDWLDSIESSSSENIPIIICGNKVDLRPYAMKRGMPCVSRSQGERLANEVGALFIETSAKDGINVNKACLQLARKLQQAAGVNELPQANKNGLTLDNDSDKPKKSGCC